MARVLLQNAGALRDIDLGVAVPYVVQMIAPALELPNIGVNVLAIAPEQVASARSETDRTIPVMLLIGDGEAALPRGAVTNRQVWDYDITTVAAIYVNSQHNLAIGPTPISDVADDLPVLIPIALYKTNTVRKDGFRRVEAAGAAWDYTTDAEFRQWCDNIRSGSTGGRYIVFDWNTGTPYMTSDANAARLGQRVADRMYHITEQRQQPVFVQTFDGRVAGTSCTPPADGATTAGDASNSVSFSTRISFRPGSLSYDRPTIRVEPGPGGFDVVPVTDASGTTVAYLRVGSVPVKGPVGSSSGLRHPEMIAVWLQSCCITGQTSWVSGEGSTTTMAYVFAGTDPLPDYKPGVERIQNGSVGASVSGFITGYEVDVTLVSASTGYDSDIDARVFTDGAIDVTVRR
ncbi:MAG: hypothetical protein NTX53_20860 [candidate division WOR-3 bacterium]|nr:hypothetical protein [candidate division WOR-3 bacterium]